MYSLLLSWDFYVGLNNPKEFYSDSVIIWLVLDVYKFLAEKNLTTSNPIREVSLIK